MSGAIVEWRPGVRTRLIAAASTGARQLCVFEQWSEPGAGAPTHHHTGVEEAVSVLAGETVVVPADRRHGSANAGTSALHALAVLAAPAPPIVDDAEPDVVYEVGGSGSVRRDAHRSIRPG